MGYREELGYLYGFEKFGVRLGLESITALLDSLGQPHRGFRSILVAGTNGKGSTCSMLGSILRQAGFSVGVYTSPEVVDLEERIAVDGRQITKEQLAKLIAEIRHAVKTTSPPPTFFEVLTALAFMHFEREHVDIAVLEVGMGGRLDATNVVEPLVSVITGVDMDHTQFLGGSIGEIAREKAGIIKEGGKVVTAADGEALSVIEEACRKKNAELVRVGQDVSYRGLGHDLKCQRFEVNTTASSYPGLNLSLLGEHQLRNAAAAIATIEALELDIGREAVRRGLKEASLPGRFELIGEAPLVVLDGAHNVAAARALRKAAEDVLSGMGIVLVVGILGDKDVEGIVNELAPIAKDVITTAPKVARASEPGRIAAAFRAEGKEAEVVKEVQEAVKRALQVAGSEDAVLVTGSLFTVGEARRALLGQLHLYEN